MYVFTSCHIVKKKNDQKVAVGACNLQTMRPKHAQSTEKNIKSRRISACVSYFTTLHEKGVVFGACMVAGLLQA